MTKKTVSFLFYAFIPAVAGAMSMDTDAPKTITAPKIIYDVKTETIATAGDTEITNASGQRLTLKDSYISKTGDKLSGDDIKLWLGQHVYVESDSITREGDITVAKDAMFTACDDCDKFGDAWQISATTIKHDMDKRMLYFYNPVLRAYNVPLLWLPFYEMPDPGVKYKTGFLMPDLASTNNMGTRINVPLYLSFSDTHDATVTLAYLTKENPLFIAEHRLNLNHSEYRTTGSFTRNKKGENRWHIFNNDVIELGEYARASIFLERASDKTYLQKYGFYEDQPYLDSGATLEVFGQSSYIIADAHIFQEMRSTWGRRSVPSGNILPNIRGLYQTKPLFAETYLTFSGDILGISGDKTASQRIIGDVRMTSPWTLWGGNRITLSASTRYDLYNFNKTDMIDGENFSGLKNRFLPSGYIEWGLPMFRPTDSWTQIIEPRARLTMMRHIDDDQFMANNDSAGALLSDSTLFSSNRFSGLDLWENGTYADYGVRYAAFNTTGHSFEVFLGQSYDFDNRADTDPNSGFHNGASDYVGRIEYNNSSWLDVRSRFRLNQEDLALRHMETSATLRYKGASVDVGHIWSQQFYDAYTAATETNEFMAGFAIQLTSRWRVGFNAIYNGTLGQFQRHTGGIFYEHPCYYMSLQYRRDNTIKEDYVGNTTFQFRLGMSIQGQHY